MSSATRFKTAIYEQIARIGKATASPARLEILDLLAQGPRTVEAVAAEIGETCRSCAPPGLSTPRRQAST